MNKIFLIGNLTKDVELNTTQSGIVVAKFSIAVKRKFKSAEGENETDFFNIVAWRQLGEFCGKYLSKGKKVCVTGAVQNRNYEGQDGIRKYITEIVADEVEFLSPKTEDSAKDNPLAGFEPIDDDNVPF